MTKSKDWCRQEKSTLVELSSHQSCLLAGLGSLRDRGLLLDISLVVGDQKFKAHKAVLASCSDYFRAMFTEPMLESRQTEVSLNGLTAEGFKILLDYAYTARLVLDQTNVQDVLSAATHVQMLSVVHACASYLQSHIDIDNCVDIANIADTYSLGHLKRRVYMFMSGHFIEFSDSHEFYRLAPQQLETLLAYEYPVNCSEADILSIVLKWFFHKDSGRNLRLDHPVRILSCIHFKNIPLRQLNKILEKTLVEHTPSTHYEYHCLYKLLSKECHRQIAHRLVLKAAAPDMTLLNSRGMELAVLKIGGFGIGGMTNEITYCLASSSQWRHLTSIPHVEQCNFGISVHKNELYVVGGCFNQSLEETIHPFGFKYSPWYNKWTTIAPMTIERCRFSLNVVGKYLYAIGGSVEVENLVEDGPETTNACERYDTSLDTWTSIPALPECRTQHAGATYNDGKDNKWIFISGGIERDTVRSSMYCYDTVNGTWRSCASLLQPRADHAMLCIGNKLYVCGGWNEDLHTGSRSLVSTVDVYHVACDMWETLTKVPTPRYHAGIITVDNKIYFIGGFHDTSFDRNTTAIECYDIETDTWKAEEKYPQVIWEHWCASLYVPKCREDMEVLDL